MYRKRHYTHLRHLFAAACLLPGLFATSSHAQDSQTSSATQTQPALTRAVVFGDAHFRLPADWKQLEKTYGKKNALWMLPNDLKDNQKFVLLLLPGEDLKEASFRDVFDALLKQSLTKGEKAQFSETQTRKTPAGYDLLTRAGVVEDADGHRTVRLYMAANPNKRFEAMVAIADSQETLKHYQAELGTILSSVAFGKANAADPATEANAPFSDPGENKVGAAGSVALGKGAPILHGRWVNVGPVTRSANGKKTDGTFLRDVALDMTDHTLYAAAAAVADFEPHGGLFASKDGGQTWKELYSINCIQVVPTGSDRIYALENGSGQILRSDDRGQTWRKCVRPRFREIYSDYASIECIAASPENPDILYAGASGVHGAGLYKSVDGGKTWTRPTRKALYHRRGERDVTNFYDNTCSLIIPDPLRPDVLYAVYGGFLMQSHDGGVNFYDCLGYDGVETPATAPQPIRVVRPGPIQIDPAMPQFGYMLCGSNLYRTGDGGQHWTQLTVPGVQFIQTIAAHPGSPQIVYVAAAQGILVSQDAGRTWSTVKSADAPKSTGGFTIPYYFNGTAFNSVATVVHENEPIIIDPQKGRLLYGTAIGLKILVPAR